MRQMDPRRPSRLPQAATGTTDSVLPLNMEI